MRNQEEINIAVARLESEIAHVPNYNFFGEDNHRKIDLTVEAIKEGWDYDDIDDKRDEDEWEDWEYEAAQDGVRFNEGDCEYDELLYNPEKNYLEKKSTVKLCNAKTCSDCPFSKNSMPGFLADYTIQDFIDYHSNEVSFPCHKHMTNEGLSVLETHKAIQDGKMPFCRGYVESIIKSVKSPRINKSLIEAVELVKEQGLSDNTMSMIEFVKFHDFKKEFQK